MRTLKDGPASARFFPLPIRGNTPLAALPEAGISSEMAAAIEHIPGGSWVSWGIPFEIGDFVVLRDTPVTVALPPTKAQWLVFEHTSDLRPPTPGKDGFIPSSRGRAQLGEHAADYVVLYDDGVEERTAIIRRRQIGPFSRPWGENCFEAVAHRKPRPVRASHEQLVKNWGWTQTRVASGDTAPWLNWLWAWRNPRPDREIRAVRLEPISGLIILSAISAGDASSSPLRWRARRKARLTLPAGEPFNRELDSEGLLAQVRLDLGQVISAAPRMLYPDADWPNTSNNQLPDTSPGEILLEYFCHEDACFHLSDGRVIPVRDVEREGVAGPVRAVSPASRTVRLKVVAKETGKCLPVKLHVHGESGEYLPPLDRHRTPNTEWFEDYSVDYVHSQGSGESRRTHVCAYIPGETTLRLPLGKNYIEVSKGFEMSPVRKILDVTPNTDEVVIELEKVLPWREMGWVTADTHVHFLSPMSALLEGAAEGVNVVNLLASQWGELMTNVGDFDGRTTWGSREAGGDGEHLVRVGTENRQHVLGHISLLGYRGPIIVPMTTGGPDESALGDPIEALLTEWARQCRKQGGLVVLPHFPNPRAEQAAVLVSGDADAVEMTSWGNLYGGIDPYSLSDWYRYLNCGYFVPAVGGTDKMSAATPVGAVRTYARIAGETPFTYDSWMEAVRRGETFVTYGPLLEFSADGRPMGARIEMTADGGTVEVEWRVAGVTIPITRVELIVNGEIRESVAVAPRGGQGRWTVRIERSSWMALLVRGQYAGKPEIIAAHGSPVSVAVAGTRMMAAADAATILDQIEGALAYLDTVGTRAEDAAYKRMRMVLVGVHRALHNRLHEAGRYHKHAPPADHREHH